MSRNNRGGAIVSAKIGTNTAKDLYARIEYKHRAFGMEHSNEDLLLLSVTLLPIKRIQINGLVQINQRQYHQQYLTTISGNTTNEYIVGNIDHHTMSLTFRGELFLTPELSLQYYGSPYYAVGKYDSFRRIDQASSKKTSERWETLDLTYDEVMDSYSFDRNSESLQFDNPDFSFMQFRSNLVFRWEYKLGSTLYVVWSHDRSEWVSIYNPVRDITGNLFGIKGNHLFIVKLNFWFSV